MGSMMQDLAFAIPGVDEAMGFAEIMKYARTYISNFTPLLTLATHRHVKSMQFSVIIFDTAPTGHTLRFLSFPSVLEKALGKLSSLGSRFGPMINQVCFSLSIKPEDHRSLIFLKDVIHDGRSGRFTRGYVREARINA